MPEQEAGERGKKIKISSGVFPLDASAFLSIQEQMSAFPPGDAAPPVDVVFFFFSLKGGQDINEVQQPLCRSHSLQDIDDMMMCARACACASLFAVTDDSLRLLHGARQPLSPIHLCFANRQFVDVSLDLICSVSL